jgi:stress response protein YsnF
MANEQHNGLQKLKGSDFEVKDGDQDIRGWDVKDGNGRTIGEVDELLFDPSTRKVRYMIVDLDDNEFDIEEHDVLIPIGLAELDKDDDDVIIRNITAEQLRSLPAYDEDHFTHEQENTIRNVFAGMGGLGLAGAAAASTDKPVINSQRDSGFYDHDHFDEEHLYRNRRQPAGDQQTIPVIREDLEVGKREMETGGVRVNTRIKEEEVEKHISLHEETVHVERTPTDRIAGAGDFREEEVEMHERAEVPVVNKEARVIEEISLNKEVTERDETIRDSVRNTEVDIDRDDTDQTRRDTLPGSL